MAVAERNGIHDGTRAGESVVGHAALQGRDSLQVRLGNVGLMRLDDDTTPVRQLDPVHARDARAVERVAVDPLTEVPAAEPVDDGTDRRRITRAEDRELDVSARVPDERLDLGRQVGHGAIVGGCAGDSSGKRQRSDRSDRSLGAWCSGSCIPSRTTSPPIGSTASPDGGPGPDRQTQTHGRRGLRPP
jgi:hypothetical protein